MLSQIFQHFGKIGCVPGDKIIPHAGFHHDTGEIRHHFLPTKAHLHALAPGKADVVAVLLGKRGHEFLLRFPLHVQAEHEFGLNAFKILAGLHHPEAERLHHFRKPGILAGHIGINLNDIAMVLLCQRFRALQKLGKSRPVVEIAHRTPAGVQHTRPKQGHFTNQKGHGTFDFTVCAPDGHRPPDPGGFLLPPEGGLGEMSLGMPRKKGLIFSKGFLCNQFVHILDLRNHKNSPAAPEDGLKIIETYFYHTINLWYLQPEPAVIFPLEKPCSPCYTIRIHTGSEKKGGAA